MSKQQPSIDKLLQRVGGSKYTLVVAASKRARDLTDGNSPLVKPVSNKPVLIALQEISVGKVRWEGNMSGIK